MKKKFLLCIVILIITFFLILYVIIDTGEISIYKSKCSYFKEEEWNLFFCIEKDSKTNTFYYNFDAYTFDDKKIEQSYIPVYNNNIEIKRLDAKVANYSTNYIYRGDTELINLYFNEKKFERNILIKDLDNLILKNIDKELLLNLYNETFYKEFEEVPGRNIDIVQYDYYENVLSNGYKFRLYWWIEYGNIKSVKINLYDDNLSVINDIKTNEMLNNLSNNIIKNNSFNISYKCKYSKIICKYEKEIIRSIGDIYGVN